MSITLYKVFRVLSAFLYGVRIAIVIYCVLSWFVSRGNRLFGWLETFVSPFVAPFRALWQLILGNKRSMIDLSCWFAVIGWSLIDWLLWRLYYILRAFAR